MGRRHARESHNGSLFQSLIHRDLAGAILARNVLPAIALVLFDGAKAFYFIAF